MGLRGRWHHARLSGWFTGIPKELLESSQIDGANAWTRFWRITLPLLSPSLFFNLVLGVIAGLADIYASLRRHPAAQARVDRRGGPPIPRSSMC